MNAAEGSDPQPVLPAPDELTRFFWDGAGRGRLMAQRCSACGRYQHPPRPVCPACHSFSLEPAEMSGRAVLYSWTVGSQAFHPWFESRLPYLLAVVELEEQRNLRLVTNLVEVEEADVEIGMPLEVTFEHLAPGVDLPVFRPAGVR